MPPRVFLLSPASCAGKRCQMLLAPRASFELAQRMQRGGVPIGEVFSFLSALYFRGKLAYAQRFAAPEGVLVITSGRGLVPADTPITLRDLRAFARVPIDPDEPRYVRPLRGDAEAALLRTEPRSGMFPRGMRGRYQGVSTLQPKAGHPWAAGTAPLPFRRQTSGFFVTIRTGRSNDAIVAGGEWPSRQAPFWIAR